MAGRRVRLDSELVRRGLATSRAEAQRLIEQGLVTVDGAPAAKPAALVTTGQALAVAADGPGWASRAAHKLLGALDRFAVDVHGCHCLDAGASTGGFTDVLLARGAARVVAVDVGYGQLVWRLRTDARVVVRDRTNARELTPDDVPPPAPDVVVADLSFISLTLVLPALRGVAAPEADFLLMVKPQFEAGREHVGKGGVVRDPEGWRTALTRVLDAAAALGLSVRGVAPSPLPGPSGNVEFFVWLRAAHANSLDATEATEAPAYADPAVSELLDAAIAEGARIAAPPAARPHGPAQADE